LIPLYAIERLEVDWIEPFQVLNTNREWFVTNRQDIVQRCCHLIHHDNVDVYVLAVVDKEQTEQIIERLLDSGEFLSDYGIRSLSKYHEDNPYVFGSAEVRYEPAESDNKIKGGNSNWRGPVWFPTTFLMIESLRKLGTAYGSHLRVKHPVTGVETSLRAIAGEIAERMIRIFVRDNGRRAVYGETTIFQEDPHWRDCVLFYEYFHGDNGAGIGASHQTGWSALVASLIDEWRR
jgi:hypothetical protein